MFTLVGNKFDIIIERFWKDPRWLPFWNHDVIPKSGDVIGSLDVKEDIFKRTTHLRSFVAIALVLSELLKEGDRNFPGSGINEKKNTQAE